MDEKKVFKIYESFFVFILYHMRRDIFDSALEGMGQLDDLKGFDALRSTRASMKGVIMSCKCCEPLVNHLGHGSLAEELAIERKH